MFLNLSFTRNVAKDPTTAFTTFYMEANADNRTKHPTLYFEATHVAGPLPILLPKIITSDSDIYLLCIIKLRTASAS